MIKRGQVDAWVCNPEPVGGFFVKSAYSRLFSLFVGMRVYQSG